MKDKTDKACSMHGGTRNAHKILVWWSIGRPRHEWMCNTEMAL